MQRRAFVSSVGGGLAALAGCTGDGTSGATTDRRTSTATGESGDVEVSVGSAHLQYGFVTPASPDSITVSNGATQYLVASVRVEGALARDDLALRIGDDVYEPTTGERLYRIVWGDDRWYERDRRHGLVVFSLPEASAGPPQLTWPTGERGLAGRLGVPIGGSPPEWSAALNLPATYDGTEAPPVVIEVRNESGRAGRFLGALNRVGPRIAYAPVARVSHVVPPGETETVTVDDSWTGMPADERIGDGDPDVTYRLDYGGDEDTAEIRLVG